MKARMMALAGMALALFVLLIGAGHAPGAAVGTAVGTAGTAAAATVGAPAPTAVMPAAYVTDDDDGVDPNSGPDSRDLTNDCPVMYASVAPTPEWQDCTKTLQHDLNSLGADLAVDGDFGPDTQDAVARFQSRNGIVDNGEADDATRQAIEDAAENKQDQQTYNPDAGTDSVCDAGSDALKALPGGDALGSTVDQTCKYVTDQQPAG
jgi:peptidoglycan hydrolase-like protein with peptidoglycan-binding domain